MRLYTIGYQGLSVDLYVRALNDAGVGLVLDVREHAWSQRPEFVKTTLSNSLSLAGIRYQHIKEAGNPARNRKTARTAAACLRRYRAHLKDHNQCLGDLLQIIREADRAQRPACLTCYERNSQNCHRSVLLEELLKLDATIIPIHLEPTVPGRPRTKESKPASLTVTAFLAPALLPFS